MTDPFCAGCRQEIWGDQFICTLCEGVYHTDCAGQCTFDANGVQLTGCNRCARSNQKRKTANNLLEMYTDNQTPTLRESFSNQQLVLRPPVFSSGIDTPLSLSVN